MAYGTGIWKWDGIRPKSNHRRNTGLVGGIGNDLWIRYYEAYEAYEGI
jgi:hypothetical protein